MNKEIQKSNQTKKKYIKPSFQTIEVDTDLSLVMFSDPPLDPGAGFIEGISKFLIR